MLALLNLWALVFSPWSTGIEPNASKIAVLGSFAVVMSLFVACIFSSNPLLHKSVVIFVVILEVLETVAMV
jgi:hypothetical protein